MTHPCELYRGAMVSYLRGELAPLEQARLEGHLGHCKPCVALRQELDQGLSAAQRYEPEIDPDHLDRLIGRLAPYTESPSGRRSTLLLAWTGVALVAASLLLVAGIFLWSTHRRPALHSTPAAPMAVVSSPASPRAPLVVQVERSEPAQGLRLVAAADWDGKVTGDDRKLSVALTHGFVAASFAGGRGRTLKVTTPTAVVEVVGTRFLVEVGDGNLVTVAVAEGKVRARAGKEVLLVSAGEARTFDAKGQAAATPALRGRAFLDDLYLVEHHAQAALVAPLHKPVAGKAGKETWSVLDQLGQAETLVNEGQFQAALTIYESCVNDPAEMYTPYRELCRLEMARLLGFKLGKLERARDLFRRLAKESRDEVGSQAALALCELDLKTNPCRAVACLKQVVSENGSRPELKREAERLHTRWNEVAKDCDKGAPR